MLAPRPAVLIALLVPALAFAQAEPAPTPADRDAPRKLEKIEVTAPDEVSERRESTAAKIVVNRDEIAKYGDTSVLDVMKRLPGVTVNRGTVAMRGLGGYTQILVNGEPVPPGFSLETLSPDLIERIEIYRSATAEFSAQAIAGTINIVLRQAVSNRRRELKAGASSENGAVSFNTTAQFSDRAGSLAYTLPLSFYDFRSRRTSSQEQRVSDASGAPVQHYLTEQGSSGEGQNLNVSPRLSWVLAKDHTVNVDGFLTMQHYASQFDERSTTYRGSPPAYASDGIRAQSHILSSRLNATWIRRLASDARLEAKAGLNYTRRSSHVDFDAFDASDVFILHRTVDGHSTDSGLTTQGKYSFPFVEGHAFVSGWDGAISRRKEDRLQLDESPVGLPPFDIDESYDARVWRLAGYAQDEWEVARRVSVYLGLRWEGIDTSDVGNVVTAVHHRSSVWSPIVQALWKLPGTDKDQLRAGLARTYKAPGTFQIIPRRYIANNNTPTTPDYQGNPDLKPELSWGLDAAYEHYFATGGVFSVSAFARRIDDVILTDLQNVNGTYITRPANVGRARTRGIELDVKTGLRTFLPSAPAVDVRANAGFYDSRAESLPGPDNRLNSQPPWAGNIGFDWKLAGPPLTVGANFNARAGGTVRTSETQVSYSRVTRALEAYGLWKFDAKTQLRVTVANLLAPDYMSVGRYLDATQAAELTSLNPGYRRFSALLEIKL